MSKVRLLTDGDYDSFLRASVRRARQRIYLTLFSADLRSDRERNFALKMLIHGLGQAAFDGVDVRLLFSDAKAGRYQRSANLPFFRFAANRGIPCRFSSPVHRSLFHSKLCLFDDQFAIFGSHNLSFEAFEKNSELSLVTYDTTFIHEHTKAFLQDWKKGKGPA